MHEQLALAQLQADLVLGYEADLLDADTIACWNPQSTLDRRNQMGYMPPKILSVTIKYIAALWDMWLRGLEVALVLEDDAELVPTFNHDVESALQEAPTGWDLIMVGTCLGIHATDESLRVSPHLFRPTFPNRPTRCGHAILWSYNGARKVLESMPLRFPLDWHINYLSEEVDLQSYWMEPALSEQARNFSSLLESERGARLY